MGENDDVRSQPAADYLEAALIKRWHAWLVAVASFFPVLFLAVLTNDSAGSDVELLHPCRLLIRRTDNQRVLKQYKYLRLGPAAQHYDVIAQKISVETVAAFCAEYDINVEDVA